MQQGYNVHSLTISPQLIQLKRKLIQPSVLGTPSTESNHIDTQKLKLRNFNHHQRQFNSQLRDEERSGLIDFKGQAFSQRKLNDRMQNRFVRKERYILPPMKNLRPNLKQQSLKQQDYKQIINSYVKKRFNPIQSKRAEQQDIIAYNKLNQEEMASFISKSKVRSKGKNIIYYKPQQIRKRSSNHIEINSFPHEKRHVQSEIKLAAEIISVKKRNKTFLDSQQQEYNFFQLQTEFSKHYYVTFDAIFTRHKNLNYSTYYKVPSFPKQQDLRRFLKQYEPHCEDIIIKDLLKSNFCSFQMSNNQIYVGQMVGKGRSGLGILFKSDMCLEGHWKKNEITKGTEINKFGVYNGTFLNNLKNGQGEFQWCNGDSYVGEWYKGLQNGKGLWINSKGQSYNGQWKGGKAQGIGILTIKNTNNTKAARKYKGAFVNNKQHGFGRQYFANGDTFQGLYKNDMPQGKGIYRWSNGSSYEGDFKQGLRQGMGLLKTSNLFYKGEFRSDCAQGECQILMQNGDKYYGMIKNGKKNGKGTLHIKSTKQVFNGYWRNDYFVNFEDADEP